MMLIHVSVEQCLILCGLVAYRDAMVGSLSTEHKKRVTIAVELSAKVGPTVPT